MTAPDHIRLISAAAKSALAPLGCTQKGRSRTWLDDHAWWVGVIEFQPSAWSRGSYLNVGACWLWYEKDYFSFDDGSRVESFQEFESVEQFAQSARILAERAKDEVLKLRQRFSSLRVTLKHLCNTTTNDIWSNYHAGVCAALVGDVRTANERLRCLAFSGQSNLLFCQEGEGRFYGPDEGQRAAADAAVVL